MLNIKTQGASEFNGTVADPISAIMTNSAINNSGDPIVTATEAELGRCNRILTHNRCADHSLAGKRKGVFVGEDARKIILNW